MFVQEDDPAGRFCVTCYRDQADEDEQEGVTSYYTTLAEARSEFERLKRGNRYHSVWLGRKDDEGEWEDMDWWPEDANSEG